MMFSIIVIMLGGNTMNNAPENKTNKSNYPVIVLWLFLGWFGAHRFYMKKHASAILMLITGVFSFFLLREMIIYGMVYIPYAVISGGIVTLLYSLPSFFLVLLFRGLIFIFIWWIIDLFIVIKFSRNDNSVA